jgi:hypothetical protein
MWDWLLATLPVLIQIRIIIKLAMPPRRRAHKRVSSWSLKLGQWFEWRIRRREDDSQS